MRTLQKLVRNGNSTQVSIPRPLLTHLGWLTGSYIVVELLEDDSVRLRKPSSDEFAPRGHQPISLTSPAGSAR